MGRFLRGFTALDADPRLRSRRQHRVLGGKKKPEERIFEPDGLVHLPQEALEQLDAEARWGARGRREEVRCVSGRYLRAEPFATGERIVDVAADASLRAAALAGSLPGATAGGAPAVLPVPRRALRRKIRTRTRKTLVVFAVDASESMAAQERMAMAKGAALAILRTAYLRRDRVAVVVFEGESARVLLEPTPSIDQARLRLRQLPIGGATPLADGLRTAWRVILSERQREPQIAATLVLLSDGRANVPLTRQADPWAEVLALADRICADGVFSLVVDTEALYPTQPELMTLAEHLGGRILRLGRGGTSALVSAVRRT